MLDDSSYYLDDYIGSYIESQVAGMTITEEEIDSLTKQITERLNGNMI